LTPLKTLRDGLVAVDLGCGESPYRPLFLPLVTSYVGIDLPENPKADLNFDPSTGKIPLPDLAVDVVISTQVLEHVVDPGAYLDEAVRVCRSDGLLFLSTHGLWVHHPDPADYWRWTGAGLQKLLSDHGWSVLDTAGVVGFAGAALQLLQDSMAYGRRNSLLKTGFEIFMQRLIGFVDSFYSRLSRQENAGHYLVVATPAERRSG
jgi:SAM-dependent methyltransferase